MAKKKIVNYGLFAALLAVLAAFVVYAFWVQAEKTPDIAEILPEDTTFLVFASGLSHLENTGENILTGVGIDYIAYSWFDGELAFAQISGPIVAMIKTNSKEDALSDCELLPEHYCDVIRGFAVFTKSEKAFERIQEVKNNRAPNLESTSDYRNVRSRLPYFAEKFSYRTASNMVYEDQLTSELKRAGLTEIIDSTLIASASPAMGNVSTLDVERGGLNLEYFIAIDKSKLGGEGLDSAEGDHDIGGFKASWKIFDDGIFINRFIPF